MENILIEEIKNTKNTKGSKLRGIKNSRVAKLWDSLSQEQSYVILCPLVVAAAFVPAMFIANSNAHDQKVELCASGSYNVSCADYQDFKN